MKITKTAILISTVTLLTFPPEINSMNVEQKVYAPKAPNIEVLPAKTFLITSEQGPAGKGGSYCHLQPIEFALGRADLSAKTRQTLLAELQRCKIGRQTPLLISGFTCHLGSPKINLPLSLQRANAVATLLRQHGYSVLYALGKGSTLPITSDPGQMNRNRRVEISIAPQLDAPKTSPSNNEE